MLMSLRTGAASAISNMSSRSMLVSARRLPSSGLFSISVMMSMMLSSLPA